MGDPDFVPCVLFVDGEKDLAILDLEGWYDSAFLGCPDFLSGAVFEPLSVKGPVINPVRILKHSYLGSLSVLPVFSCDAAEEFDGLAVVECELVAGTAFLADLRDGCDKTTVCHLGRYLMYTLYGVVEGLDLGPEIINLLLHLHKLLTDESAATGHEQ